MFRYSMDEQKVNEIIKKVRSIPYRKEVYSKKYKKYLQFLRVVTYGEHKGDVFFSGLDQPVSNIFDIAPSMLRSWDEWEVSGIFASKDKAIDKNGKIILYPNQRYNIGNEYISFAMKPEDYFNNIIPGEILFIRIKDKGNYLICASESSNKDIIKYDLYKPLDSALALSCKENPKSPGFFIRISDCELIRPAVKREVEYFYGKTIHHIAEDIKNTPEEELRPFKTKVLVANEVNDYWLPAIFGTCIDRPSRGRRYAVVGGQIYKRCIIYKGDNKKLLGTQVKSKTL